MFVQIIRGKVADEGTARAALDRFIAEVAPGAIGWLGATSGVSADGELWAVNRFESEEAARANSARPEQDAYWTDVAKMFDGEPTFIESTDVDVEMAGDLDTAGFVQIMLGQSLDPKRSKELMSDGAEERMAFRPDVLGALTVGHEDGKFTMVIYFTSEAAAREGERKPPPPEAQAAMKEMMSLSVGIPEFVDLRHPRLDSPK